MHDPTRPACEARDPDSRKLAEHDSVSRWVSEMTRLRQRFNSAIPPLVVVLVGVALNWPLTRLQLVSHDHPLHLFSAWQLWTQLLPHGQLRGWSHDWSFGYPAGELVPCGGALWVALFRLLTFGRLSWPATYNLAFAGVIIFSGLASYTLASRYWGRAAGTLSGLFMMLDPGSLWQGGWAWHSAFGVWPATLSCAFLAMTYAKLEDAIASSRRRHVIGAGLWMVGALLAHPLSLLLLGMALPIMLFDYWSRARANLGFAALRGIGTYAIGFGLTGFYLIPFVARSHVAYDFGLVGDSVETWAKRFVELQVFENNWALIGALGMIGTIRALQSRRPGSVFMPLACGSCFLLATDIVVNVLHLELAFPSLVKVQFGRLVMAAKTFFFPLAAFGVTSLFRKHHTSNPAGFARSVARWLVVGAVAAPFALPVAKRVYDTYVAKTFDHGVSEQLLRDYKDLNAWALTERLSSSAHYRIAYDTASLFTLPTIAPMLSGTSIYMIGGTPNQNFSRFPDNKDPKLLEAASVKYLVSDHPVSDPDFVPLRTYGALNVYRFSRYHEDPFTLIGQGHGELLTFQPKAIRIHISGAGPDTRLKLHVARYDRWEATQNGEALPITAATVYDHEYPYLMEIPVKNGDIEFRYVRRLVDWIGLMLSVATAIAVALLTMAPKRCQPGSYLGTFAWRFSGAFRWIAVGVAASIVLVAALRSRTRRHLLPPESVFHGVKSKDMILNGHYCEENGPLDFDCERRSLRADHVQSWIGIHLCMVTANQGPLTLNLATQLGSALEVYSAPSSEVGYIKVGVDAHDLGTVAVKSAFPDFRIAHFDTRRFAHQNGTKLHIEISGGALSCFDIRVMP